METVVRGMAGPQHAAVAAAYADAPVTFRLPVRVRHDGANLGNGGGARKTHGVYCVLRYKASNRRLARSRQKPATPAACIGDGELPAEGRTDVHVDSAEQIVFYIVAGIAVLGALGVVFSQDIIHSALYLVLTLMMTAGVFVLLSAEFLALVQVLVYGGGVAILVLFAAMITRVRELRQPLDGPQKPFAIVAGLAVVSILILMVVRTHWLPSGAPSRIQQVVTAGAGGRTVSGTDAIGHDLFTNLAVPFEIASLVLLVALIGAIVLTRGEEEDIV